MLWRKNKAGEGGKGALEQEVGRGADILNSVAREAQTSEKVDYE